MPSRLTSRPGLVISASRRTELLAHYPDYLAARLHRIGPRRVHTVVLWTKDPSNLFRHRELRATLDQVGQVFVHWTVTGLGGTFLEPSVPPAETQFGLIADVVSYVGDPRRIHLRYDPLVAVRRGTEELSNVSVESFRAVAAHFAEAGVPAVHTSFVTLYPKVRARLDAAGVVAREYSPTERREFLEQLSAAASALGMELITCCEPGYPIRRCIDGELLSALHPCGAPCRTDRARGQRELCGCTVSLDIGRYLPCPNRCLYCYAHPAR